MPPRGDRTRSKLLDAATELFAARGVASVSLSEITDKAGQRNASALHYHFGSREGLIAALMERHVPGIRARRSELLQIAIDRPGDARAAAEAVVVPNGELLDGDWRARAFLRIAAELLTGSTRRELQPLLGDTALFDSEDLLFSRIPEMPPALRRLRSQVAGMMTLHAIADYSLRIDARPARKHNIWLFVANLIDMYIAALTSPASPATDELLRAAAAEPDVPVGGVPRRGRSRTEASGAQMR
jgi:AcrR family transcriptional regulator